MDKDNKYSKLLKTKLSNEEISNFFWKMNSSSEESISLVCRGDKMTSWNDFANEISAVLQFPYYYNGGTDSFHECIRDLAWIFKKRIFVFIVNSKQISIEVNLDFLKFFEDSSLEVPEDAKQYDKIEKHVYYIFQDIDKDFPLFEDKDISEYP